MLETNKQHCAELLYQYQSSVDSLPHNKLGQATLDFLKQELGLRHLALFALPANEDNLCVAMSYEEEQMEHPDYAPVRLNNALLFSALQRQQPVYRTEVPESDPVNNQANGHMFKSDFTLPLCSEGRCLGLLYVGSHDSNGLSSATREFIGLLKLNLVQYLDNFILNQNLNENCKALQSLNNISPFGIFKTDAPGNYIYVNKRWCDITGQNHDEALNKGWIRTVHPDDKGRVFLEWNKAVKTGQPFKWEYRLLRKDGNITWIQGQAEAEKNTRGEVTGYLGMITDIDDHKCYEQALKKSRTTLEEAQRIAHIGNWELDLDNNSFTCSKEFYRIFELKHDQLGASYFDYLGHIHPDDVDSVSTAYVESLHNKAPYRIVYRLLLKGDRIKYIKESCETIYDDQGEPIYSLGTVQDITDQKMAENKLRQTATVVENTAEGVIITDARNNIIEVNRALCEITGYSEDELLGKNPNILKSDRHNGEFYSQMWKTINMEGRWQGELWDRRKDGGIFPVWSTITAIQNSSGKIANYVSVLTDISLLKHSQEKLDFLAHHDPLTLLPNRTLFNDRMTHAIQRCKRENGKLAVLFLDLDLFKSVNDTLGHAVGDELLQLTSGMLGTCLRKQDTLARIGGDEFVILMEDITHSRDAALIAQKIIDRFNEPLPIKEHKVHINFSIGISVYPDNGTDPKTLLKNADLAMYRTKEKGRQNYHFYTPKLTSDTFERFTMQSALKQAVEQNQLLLHYQPVFNLQTGKIIAAEALLRWQHPELGLILPDKFIPLAEESSLIVEIGTWVLNTATLQFKKWIDAGLPIERIAVNISPGQFQHNHIVDTVDHVISSSGIDSSQLELEITEKIFKQKTFPVHKSLASLQQLGVTIAIDDFGTGCSSLHDLKHLPIHRLKIDRSFVRNILLDNDDLAITRAVNALGQSLSLQVVAEGVETQEQLEFLRSIGCHDMQGYYFNQPVSSEEFELLLK